MGEDKTATEEMKSVLHLPRTEHLPYALLTGAYILFATGLLLLMQGLAATDTMTQAVTYLCAVAVFCLGGYFLHSYHRWLVRQVK